MYQGWVRKSARKIGLNKILSDPYWLLVHTLSDDSHACTVSGIEVKFRTETRTEVKRFHDLSGERPVIENVLRSLNPDDTFYDIGANVGTYTCFSASKLGPDRTIAFEPEPENATRLQENLELNNLDAKIVEVALSDTDGTTSLALKGNEAGEGEHTIATDGEVETVEVETARGDSIIEQHDLPAPTVVKIDVEGAELSVLRGLQETIRENCRLVYVEVHPEKIMDFGGEASEVNEFLTEAGFEVTEIAQRGNEVFLRASK